MGDDMKVLCRIPWRRSEFSVAIDVKARDMWMGLYWVPNPAANEWFAFVCLLPCLPIRLHYGARAERSTT